MKEAASTNVNGFQNETHDSPAGSVNGEHQNKIDAASNFSLTSEPNSLSTNTPVVNEPSPRTHQSDTLNRRPTATTAHNSGKAHVKQPIATQRRKPPPPSSKKTCTTTTNSSSNKDNKTSGLKASNSYVQCPVCERSFNRAAAERHIPWCQQKQQQQQSAHSRSSNANTEEALARFRARNGYQPLRQKAKGEHRRKGREEINQGIAEEKPLILLR